MANQKLPSYLASAKPVPKSARAPGLMTTGAAFAGIYLWIAYYDKLGSALSLGNLGSVILGVIIGGGLSFALYYLVSGTWGMKTGLPLYIVGSSTFGTTGGYFLPGVFMGVLQIGWYSVATYYATTLVINGLGGKAITLFGPGEEHGFSALFVIVAVVWGYLFAFFGAKGIKYVARMANIFPVVPIIMLLIGAVMALKGLGKFGEVRVASATPDVPTIAGMLLAIQMVIGFSATAMAAGADFTQNNRNASDVKIGGLAGIWAASVVVGILALITVAGANGANAKLNNFSYAGSLGDVGGFIAKIMLILFAIGSMAPACFCSFIIGNSLSTMIPSISRMKWTMGGATLGIILGATGVAGNLESFFGLIGASFGPVCGAMAADFLLSGGKWPGPRKGVNAAGYAAWAIGFLVGISNNAVLGKLAVLKSWHPAALYSFVVGFIVYLILAKAGLEPAKEEAYTVTEPPDTPPTEGR
jgi:cytosine permease